MRVEKIAVSNRQLALFALLFLAPLAFSRLLVGVTSPAPAADNADLTWGSYR